MSALVKDNVAIILHSDNDGAVARGADIAIVDAANNFISNSDHESKNTMVGEGREHYDEPFETLLHSL